MQFVPKRIRYPSLILATRRWRRWPPVVAPARSSRAGSRGCRASSFNKRSAAIKPFDLNHDPNRPNKREVRFAPINGHRQPSAARLIGVESRCGAVALGSSISVAAPFVRRCLTGSTMAPFSHPAHRTGQADFPHPALGQNFTPSPTARRAQAGSGVRGQSARKGARVDRSRPCDAWFCA